MRCVILNRNYPPNAGITGHSASELAVYLQQHGVEVHIVTVGGNYQGGVSSGKVIETATLHLVSKIYDGKSKILRLIASLVEGRRMAKQAVALGIAPLITLTDPPLLNYWVARICRRRRIPWIYWSMDIYPEAFVAAGLTKADAFFYRYFKQELLKSVPDHLIALGDQQSKYLQGDAMPPVSTSILPCGVDRIERSENPPAWMPVADKITFCYIGNLGQAHDPRFVEAVIASLDPEKHHFILAVYGIHASRLLKFAAGIQHVTILDGVKRDELGWIDVHLASLEPTWDHVCVPSKAVSAVCAGSSLLLCASVRCDNWHMLQDASWRTEPGDGMPAEVTRIVASLTPAAVSAKRANAHACAQHLHQVTASAMTGIFDAVKRLQPSS
jgi:hypothetical protein